MRLVNIQKAKSEKGFVLLLFALLLPILIFATKFVIEYSIYKSTLDEIKTSSIKSLNESIHFFDEPEKDLLAHLKAKLILDLNPINIEDLNKRIKIKNQSQKEASASRKLFIQKCEVRKYVNEKAYDISEYQTQDNAEFLSVPYDENRYTFQLIKNRILSDIVEDFRDLGITTYNLKYDDMTSNVKINDFSCHSNAVPKDSKEPKDYKKWTYKIFLDRAIDNDIFKNIFWKKIAVLEYEIPSISFFVKVSFDDRVKLQNAGYIIHEAVTDDAVTLDTDQNENFYNFSSLNQKIKNKTYEIDLDNIELKISKFQDYNILTLNVPGRISTLFDTSPREFNCTTKIKFYDNSVDTKDNYTKGINVGIAVPVKTDTSNLNLYHIIMNNIACLVDKFDPKNTSVAVVPYYSKIKLPKDIFQNIQKKEDIILANLPQDQESIETKDFLISLKEQGLSEELKTLIKKQVDLGNGCNCYNISKNNLVKILEKIQLKTLTFSSSGEMDQTNISSSYVKNYNSENPETSAIDLFFSSPYDTYDVQGLELNILKDKLSSESQISVNGVQLKDLYFYRPKNNIISVYYPENDISDPSFTERNVMEVDQNQTFHTDDRSSEILHGLNLVNPTPPLIQEDGEDVSICNKNPYNPFSILKLSSPSIAAMYLRLLNSIQTDEQSNFINIGALWSWRMISTENWLASLNNSNALAQKIILLIITKDINFSPNEKTVYGILNDNDKLFVHNIQNNQHLSISHPYDKNSFGVNITKLSQLTVETLTRIMKEGVKLYVVEILPMEHETGFPNLKNYVKNAVESFYGRNTVHFQRCAIENNRDDKKIDDLIRNLFKNIEDDLHLKNTLKSVNYHSSYMIIED